ncbi:MAG: NADH-quinone oxidoreductase subunit L [Deltaproteobacteria bacterium]|nr:NADH-quinone oxidoreductase subunit L [Deltaproteobacteria bacterium]
MTMAVLTILFMPLLGFVIQIFVGKRLFRGGDWISIGTIFVSFALSILLFTDLLSSGSQFHWTTSWMWIDLPSFQLNMGILVDPVTVLMLLVITTVSFLVFLYSVGYMHNDPRYSRYFAYLSFFSFSMIGLVLADNLFALYIFWELVGLASYLLISFWFEKPEAAQAGKKAFIVTRIGDIGMFIGILIIFFETNGLLHFENIFDVVSKGQFGGEFLGISLLTLAGICIFLGAVGKSAQFPLHIWLPDAMEGPTPVSALIHAATMVAAGVYLVTRMFPFFSPDALTVIAYTGAFTAIFAATMAVTHNDIKKVLAYSTISQLGYMMMGLGVGAYVAGFFHLVTHAAFKACLFLCSGSVIHALHTQDMREMGGLRKKMPVTFATMLIATLALSGIPFFSGFVSKDMILAETLSLAMKNPSHFLIPLFGFVGAGLTAFYMFRLIFMTFYGTPKDVKKFDHAHESPWVMTLPLIVLSLCSLAIFFTGSPLGLGELELFGEKSQWFKHLLETNSLETHSSAHTYALFLSLAVAGLGIFFATLIYYKQTLSAEKISEKFSSIYKTLTHLYWIDELYEWAVINNLLRLNNFLANFDNRVIDQVLVDGWAPITVKTSRGSGDFDNRVIDQTLVDGTGKVVQASGREVRKIQTGKIQQYLLIGLGAVCGILILLIFL